jgi:uncharacterized protein YpmB
MFLVWQFFVGNLLSVVLVLLFIIIIIIIIIIITTLVVVVTSRKQLQARNSGGTATVRRLQGTLELNKASDALHIGYMLHTELMKAISKIKNNNTLLL